ncbi:hypothetical protein FWG95_03575 [Candidatus Saccharibacteria bacterium]|nr:hypothetical protein [Candidatus Saccharibacteria bacterium]
MVNKLVIRLQRDFPEFRFEKSEIAHWSPSTVTVFYGDKEAELLHELGHALLDHNDFAADIELLHIERDAWEKARQLAPKYEVEIDDDTVETALDGYRDWLHARSLCPHCRQTGLQDNQTLDYYCVNCNARWQANDARVCGLKRKMLRKA